jgi:hypothetical protein
MPVVVWTDKEVESGPVNRPIFSRIPCTNAMTKPDPKPDLDLDALREVVKTAEYYMADSPMDYQRSQDAKATWEAIESVNEFIKVTESDH